MSQGVSVIICCYNSEERIADTLIHLLKQQVPEEIQWEVIIVNNASTDGTVNAAEATISNHQRLALFKIIHEPVAGLAYARLAGMNTARFDTLIFCDDDNSLDQHYVAKACKIMEILPETGIAAGWIRPKLPTALGPWIEDFYASLAIDKAPKQDGYVDWVYGAGMVIRKRIFEELEHRGISLLLSDRVGKKQTSGGDAEMCQAVRFIGYNIFYSSQLSLEHCISAHRLTKQSFISANYRNVFPVAYLYLMENIIRDRSTSAADYYKKFFRERISMIVHFFPRWIVGQHRFYSFIMLFQNVQLVFWLILKRPLFILTYHKILNNLYHGQ